ncbi:vWA domain-containing protein [Corynebacterium gerontici]|uniref:vWA domain-containing protein n=1 Tax=Corynebacterium gerontici TaxID=2079234 RepID=UPI001FE2DA78|nr:VWA domain-containing protein [Corynebacterium gerontici]
MFQRRGLGEEGIPGRRSRAYSAQGTSVRAIKGGHGLHLVGTVRAAAERGAVIDGEMLRLQARDLRGQLRRGMESNLIVFVVDASGSMAARDRLESVTGAVVSMLQDAYQRRDKVAVISVRGAQPEVVLPPTGSIDVAVRRLEGLKTGGRTPLGEGLMLAHEMIQREHRKEPGRRALLVVLSDGRATGAAGLDGSRNAAALIQQRGLAGSVVIDAEQGKRIKLGLAKELAWQLGGICVQLEHLSADALSEVVAAV